MESLNAQEVAIDSAQMSERLRTLSPEEFSPDTIEFAEVLADKLPETVTPGSFLLASQLVMYDRSLGVDLFGKSDEELEEAIRIQDERDASSSDETAEEKYMKMLADLPSVARAVSPEPFADEVINWLDTANEEAADHQVKIIVIGERPNGQKDLEDILAHDFSWR